MYRGLPKMYKAKILIQLIFKMQSYSLNYVGNIGGRGKHCRWGFKLNWVKSKGIAYDINF